MWSTPVGMGVFGGFIILAQPVQRRLELINLCQLRSLTGLLSNLSYRPRLPFILRMQQLISLFKYPSFSVSTKCAQKQRYELVLYFRSVIAFQACDNHTCMSQDDISRDMSSNIKQRVRWTGDEELSLVNHIMNKGFKVQWPTSRTTYYSFWESARDHLAGLGFPSRTSKLIKSLCSYYVVY